MSERPTPCPDCGSTYNCYPECHWECNDEIERLERRAERMETVLKQIAGDNHLTLTEHQLMAKWALGETA